MSKRLEQVHARVTEEEKLALEQLNREHGVSYSEVIRRGIKSVVAEIRKDKAPSVAALEPAAAPAALRVRKVNEEIGPDKLGVNTGAMKR